MRSAWIRYWQTFVVLPFAVAVAVLTIHVQNQNDALDYQQKAIVARQQADARNHQVLTELCKTNAIIEGLVNGTMRLFEYEIGVLPPPPAGNRLNFVPKPLVDKALVPAYSTALNTFLGWSIILGQQTACKEILHP